jgi:hypothetical protein
VVFGVGQLVGGIDRRQINPTDSDDAPGYNILKKLPFLEQIGKGYL